MANNSKEQVTVIHVKNPKAIALCAERAKRENRTATNACETTLLEALGDDSSQQDQNTPGRQNWQDKITTKNSSP